MQFLQAFPLLWSERIDMIESVIEKTPSVHIVGASAGTGKTTRLVSEYVSMLDGSGSVKTDPTRILVCTFTNKAADELTARIRQKLLQVGQCDAAHMVLSSYVGTVNSICGRLLRDYALEGGLAPEQDVIPEHMQANLFAIASASVIDAYAQRVEEQARRLSFMEFGPKSKFQKRAHWMDHVRTICTLARANGIPSEHLRASAERSWQGMQRQLGKAERAIDGDTIDELLLSGLENAINKIDLSSDTSELSARANQTLRECFARARSGAMTWKDWASVKKLQIGVQNKPAITDLVNVCNVLHLHPRLHSDLKNYLKNVFDCAADCLEAYQTYKSANGLVDFVDQEYLTLGLLDKPAVQESLRSRLDLVLIDEFQDTSPIQLALFIKLAKLSKHSIWVGDIKQAIYGFRGTDPQLMQAAAASFERRPPLEQSFRSCPELVSFTNEIFKTVFPAHGIRVEDVVIRPSGNRPSASSPAIEFWNCHGKELAECFGSLASGLHTLLNSERTEIADPETGAMRALRGSDIAILCRKNDHCLQVADALARKGLKVAMTRQGLLDSPECLLATATLRFLVDPADKLALGQMIHLQQNYLNQDQSAWLAKWLAAGRNPEKLLDIKPAIDAARKALGRLTISDALSRAIELGHVLPMVYGWGNVSSRLSNLDALRGLVTEYEDTCGLARSPATVAGFLLFLEQLEDSEQPACLEDDAVHVITYHAAKGLEWPLVILCDLDSEAAPKVHKDLCKIHVESPDVEFDIDDPLQGRWIRFWPWPFGAIEKDGAFEPNASASPEFIATIDRVRAENTRLMYVGMTRARDRLVFAPYTGRTFNPSGIQWLDELKSNGKPLLVFPKKTGPCQLQIGEKTHSVAVRSFSDQITVADASAHTTTYTLGCGSKKRILTTEFKPYVLRPSSQHSAEQEFDPSQVIVRNIGERIPLIVRADMNRLGECIHSFLSCDKPEEDESFRLENARQITQIWRVEALTADDLVLMSNRLHLFLRQEFGDYRLYRECTVHAKISGQRIRGSIDMLLETEQSFHIIDHKSFPGDQSTWMEKAFSFKSQLQSYADALALAVPEKKVKQMLVHMPILGIIVQI